MHIRRRPCCYVMILLGTCWKGCSLRTCRLSPHSWECRCTHQLFRNGIELQYMKTIVIWIHTFWRNWQASLPCLDLLLFQHIQHQSFQLRTTVALCKTFLCVRQDLGTLHLCRQSKIVLLFWSLLIFFHQRRKQSVQCNSRLCAR